MFDVVGIGLDTARTAALVVAVVAVTLALVSAWLLKAIVSKLFGAIVFGALALVVWTQWRALDDCADDVRRSPRGGVVDDATCEFFGRDVTIRSPRAG